MPLVLTHCEAQTCDRVWVSGMLGAYVMYIGDVLKSLTSSFCLDRSLLGSIHITGHGSRSSPLVHNGFAGAIVTA